MLLTYFPTLLSHTHILSNTINYRVISTSVGASGVSSKNSSKSLKQTEQIITFHWLTAAKYKQTTEY